MLVVTRYEPQNKGKLIGLVDVLMDYNGVRMLLKRISHVQNGEKKWFNLPSYRIEKGGEEFEYFKYWQFEDPKMNLNFLRELEKAVSRFLETPNMTNDDLPF